MIGQANMCRNVKNAGSLTSVDDCAAKCKYLWNSSHFMYQRMQCNHGWCVCYCAKPEGCGVIEPHNAYDLYMYNERSPKV